MGEPPPPEKRPNIKKQKGTGDATVCKTSEEHTGVGRGKEEKRGRERERKVVVDLEF